MFIDKTIFSLFVLNLNRLFSFCLNLDFYTRLYVGNTISRDSYLGGVIVADTIGSEYVGYLSAITSAFAALVAIPLPWLTATFGRPLIMLFGTSSWILYLLIIMCLSTEEAGNWGVLLLLYILAGLGRGIWEAVVKAVFADYFHEEEQPAVFACLHVQSGASGAIGYFVFPNIGKTIKAWSCVLIALLG
jgi:MFS family permease